MTRLLALLLPARRKAGGRLSLFVVPILLLVFPAPPAAEAQQAGKVYRIGYLDQGPVRVNRRYVDGLREGLHERGWVEGRNFTMEARFAEGRTDQLSALAADLVRLKIDLIATTSTPAALAAKQATATIPIVIGFVADPVGSGIVASLAHPGANVTGWTHQGVELRAKYLDLLKEAIPVVSRFGVLWNPANPVHRPSFQNIDAAARQLKVEVHEAGVQNPNALQPTFSALVEKGVQALVVFPDGLFLAQMDTIIALAAKHRLPTMYGLREYVDAGGLISYGTNLAEMNRQIGASFVDKILKGAKPGDLPIEQPTKFELVINLKPAKALGLTIPQSLLLRANQLIQ